MLAIKEQPLEQNQNDSVTAVLEKKKPDFFFRRTME
jgi:hypothetical protein